MSAKLWKWVWELISDSLCFQCHSSWWFSGLQEDLSAVINEKWLNIVFTKLGFVQLELNIFISSTQTQTDKTFFADVVFKLHVLNSSINKCFLVHLDLMWNKMPLLCEREIHPDLTISDLGQLGEEEPAVTRCWCRETCARTHRLFLQRAFACSLLSYVWYLANILLYFLFLTAQNYVGLPVSAAVHDSVCLAFIFS